MLFKILSQNCGKTFDEIYEISRRDKWFNSEESKEIGLIDNIIVWNPHFAKLVKQVFDKNDVYFLRYQ